ncbi:MULTISPECIES: peptide ABC transporter substrate-binding protein [Cytobacillus]|jgi:dipeptide transport system substrate-binding protein|uniref:Oligopeptide ABC transporter substrate-binding protein n=3 Tax=Cytobacillus TaxID=2675230 RepID=A0A160M618_9BACI|nr:MULTISPECIES: peptide ABC transporter substrate-binding protein [Cytobacillus]MCS0826913.1 peptide ABC transporter substrate-binding protein [Cytobacillus firmus]AND37837.1 oligopeptide ABC transporter substrate-binding protein [Cytobacillus oceanisediminis 2691]MBU8732591.1 peptide ABC transporter substrate-binding protein [Cytobacillus oceanisediminis]MCM3245965.1 peptide ABC transporter substrate-binding protein [Cytobacillus oceanisediminis]MCM3405079.1 peptide ABC transporter substrate
MKKFLSLLLAGVLLFVMAACTANENAGKETDSKDDGKKEEESAEKVLYLNNGQEPTSFDPPIGFDSVSWSALNNLMEGLTRLGQDHEPEAAIAEKWDISEDGKVYTFHIREDAKWSNGDPVTAGDFEFAWKRLLNPDTGSSAAFLGYFIEGGEAYNNGEGSADDVKVKAVDDKTFEVTLVSPQAYFLSVITNPAFFPINEKVATENPKWFAEAESFVGNGPFNLTEWEHDSHFVMEKNDQYWDAETVKLDKIHWAIIDDTNTEYQMYQSGELDVSDVPSELSEQLLGEAKVEDQAGDYFYRFNVNMEPFQNLNIRKAFAMAVDQQQIVDFVTKNGEKPAYGFVSYGFTDPSGKDFREVSGDLVKTNAEEAKALLEKGMEEEGYDKLPEVTLTYSTDDTHKKIAEALQQMFKENLGVEVKLANMEWNVFAEEQKALKFQLSRSSFLADYADPINFLENFQTGHSMNRTGWSNEKYDQLIKDAKNEADEAKRFELMYEAEKILFEEMPIIPIHFYNQVYLYNDAVSGIVRHPVGYMELKWADKK